MFSPFFTEKSVFSGASSTRHFKFSPRRYFDLPVDFTNPQSSRHNKFRHFPKLGNYRGCRVLFAQIQK
ncbi:MAG: hypothetical protein DRH06_10795 [Deltaproteobacteria bacterium]|nr:MAG: hypothetical protein DRH06_10795 [Deltaproteobacteria bacterium]